MIKEHLVYMTPDDIDSLIERIYILKARIDNLLLEATQYPHGDEYRNTLERSADRLNRKHRELLLALKQALEGVT